jgi:hypothetical protein
VSAVFGTISLHHGPKRMADANEPYFAPIHVSACFHAPNLAGVPIERVSVLLGHQSVRVTEKHYNPWVRSRQEQLEADVRNAWANDETLKMAGTKQVQIH